jgi:tripartite-type tricarboxylate transporter receptor subunit TctC
VNVSLFANAGYDAERDFRAGRRHRLAAQPDRRERQSPVKSLAELIDLAKKSKLAYASPGVGTTPHLTAENLFRITAKLDITPFISRVRVLRSWLP